MADDGYSGTHSAEAAALGFYYQSFFGLLTLLQQSSDNAGVAIERLDDVELQTDGHKLLYQLKHSISVVPPPITLKSRALWHTIKIWADILPGLTLSETTLHLVAVGGIPGGNPLTALTSLDADREELAKALTMEAQRVIDARMAAANANPAKPLPYEDRSDGCEAFLALSESERLNLLRRALIRQDSPSVAAVEELIAAHLKILPADQRVQVAARLVEWWDRQIVYSLCGRGERLILRTELQRQISTFVADIEHGKLLAEFETVNPPSDYQPDGMLSRQIKLVEGKPSDYTKAIRDEWRAREQRSKWLNGNPAMAVTIHEHDCVLKEQWSDRHCKIVEDGAQREEKEKCASGLKILRWTHEEAPNVVRPIAEGWNAAYYVRGSYQVLAIDLKVGWHPDYEKILGSNE
jgi:hypothetical protein